MERKNYLIDTNVAIYYFGLALSAESEKFMDMILGERYSISVINRIQIRKKYSIKLPDAIIAATCLAYKCSLITNNIKDFDKITGLHLVKVDKRT